MNEIIMMVLYTDGKGNFAIGLENESLFRYAQIEGQLYGKFVEDRERDESITLEEMDWKTTLETWVAGLEN